MIKNTLNLKKNCAGQAAAELAILGTLVLLCFSTLLIYGQRLEEQQTVKMEAFRKALQKSYERNSSVSYTLKKDTRFFNLLGSFGEGEASNVSSTASVMWQKGTAGLQGTKDDASFAYYQVNDQMVGDVVTGLPRYNKTVIDYTGKKNENVKVPSDVWREESKKQTAYSLFSRKQEDNSGTIVNTKQANLQESSTTQVFTRFDYSERDARKGPGEGGYVLPKYAYEGGSYEHEGDTIAVNAPAHNISSQGAFYIDPNLSENADKPNTNRYEYRSDAVGAQNIKQRTWQTPY